MTFRDSAREAVLKAATDLEIRSGQMEIVRSLDATESAQWLKEVAQRLREACETSPGVASENAEIEAAYEALEGRLGSGDNADGKAEKVLAACEEYVLTEDALPGDEFDGEHYALSGAVALLVKQRNDARDGRERALNALRALSELPDWVPACSDRGEDGHVSCSVCVAEEDYKKRCEEVLAQVDEVLSGD
jgi:hypothetical protein